MELKITARHFEILDPTREYAEKRILPLERFFGKVLDAQLILSKERNNYNAELVFKVSRSKLLARASASDINSAIDEVSHKMERQLKGLKEKVKNKKVNKKAGLSESQDVMQPPEFF